MFYIEFDASGRLCGRYTTAIHGEAVPPHAVEVADELFRQTIAETDGTWMLGADGRITKVPLPPPSNDSLAMVADADRQALLADAALRIAPLQDAVDLGTATEEETAKLLAWKRYRVELNRIEQQDGYPRTIGWPTPPA